MPRLATTDALVASLNRIGCVSRSRGLLSQHGRTALERARSCGAVNALLPRIYAHPRHEGEFETRIAATMEWLPGSVAITGLAACYIYELIDVPPAQIRASAPSPLHVRSPAWLRLRRCIVPSLTHEQGGVRLVSVAEAIVHAWEEDRGRGQDAIFVALRTGKVTVAQLASALSYYPRVRGRRRLERFLRHLLDGMHSFLEYRGALTVLNSPDLVHLAYQTQFIIEGNVFYADRYDPQTRTAVEFDGMRWHGSAEARERDRWRDALFRSAGIEPVHLLSTDVFDRPGWCRELVRTTIAARASPP